MLIVDEKADEKSSAVDPGRTVTGAEAAAMIPAPPRPAATPPPWEQARPLVFTRLLIASEHRLHLVWIPGVGFPGQFAAVRPRQRLNAHNQTPPRRKPSHPGRLRDLEGIAGQILAFEQPLVPSRCRVSRDLGNTEHG